MSSVTRSLLLVAFALVGCSGNNSTTSVDVVMTDVTIMGDTSVRRDARSDVIDAGRFSDTSMRTDAVEIADAGCSIDTMYTYGYTSSFDAGLEQYSEYTTIGSSMTWSRTRIDGTDATLSCSVLLPACGADAGFDVGAVVGAMADREVQAAFNETGTPVFGIDNRPSGGQVFAFQRADGAQFAVGDPCSGAPGCRDIPQGVAILVGLLSAVDQQQLEDPSCAALR